MPNYRRVHVPGSTYFFTVVTYDRQLILCTPLARRILRAAWERVCAVHPFETTALCLLPDHLHCLWTLPDTHADYSLRWRAIKGLFTRRWLETAGTAAACGESRPRKREAAVWQPRFWEHWIRNEDDLRRHIDYIHFNPEKHEYAQRVADWPWSSFHRYVREGWYEPDWGAAEPLDLPTATEVGEP